jgi:hypothetical protein
MDEFEEMGSWLKRWTRLWMPKTLTLFREGPVVTSGKDIYGFEREGDSVT